MSRDACELPLFPLPIVAFPGDLVPLHIFELRYQAMIQHCLEGDEDAEPRQFVVCLEQDDVMQELGTAVHVVQIINTFDDGRMDILVQGDHRVLVEDSYPGDAFVLARVVPYRDEASHADGALVTEVSDLCRTYLGLIHTPAVVPEVRPEQVASFRIATGSIDDLVMRQNLLKMRGEEQRLTYLQRFYRKAIPELRRIEEVTNRVKTNGHFKSIPGQPGT